MIMDVANFIAKHKVSRKVAERIVSGFLNVAGVKADEATERNRIEICNNCEVFNDELRLCDVEKGGCGCFVDIKTKYLEIDFANFKETVKCPLGKW